MGLWGRGRPVRRAAVAVAVVLALGTGFAACDSGSDEADQEIADLTAQLEESEAQLEQTQAALAESEDRADAAESDLATANTELEATQSQLDATTSELSQAQAELLDAQAQLAQVGELVLEDGTYVGQVLAAKASPYRVILFDASGLWRVAQVADDVTITSGGDDLTLSQLGKLLQSTDPDDINLVNGDYQVKVKNGLVTSLRKSNA